MPSTKHRRTSKDVWAVYPLAVEVLVGVKPVIRACELIGASFEPPAQRKKK
jgi:hypothetical protein